VGRITGLLPRGAQVRRVTGNSQSPHSSQNTMAPTRHRAEVESDLGLGVAGSKQRPSLHADAFEGVAVAQRMGVAAVGGGSHTAAMLPARARSRHRNRRSSPASPAAPRSIGDVPGCGRDGIGEVAKQATKRKKYGAISAGGSGLAFFSDSIAVLQ
jgi:hypothetical protein